MRARWVVGVVLAGLVAGVATPAAATEPSRSMVRIRSGLNGWSKIQFLCNLLDCQVARALDALPGETGAGSLFLVYDLPPNLPQGLPLGMTLGLLGVEAIEADLPVRVEDHEGHNDLSGCWGANQATSGVLDDWDNTPVVYYGSTVWQGYLAQPAADIVRVRETHCTLGATGGTTVVAIIDTGVDRSHPTLQPFLTQGYDFTRDVDGGDETVDLNQATAGVLDGIYGVNQSTAAALNQATAGVLDDVGYSHFGHGTMVAGLVHLVAPTARIMPLKAFTAGGVGYTSDIVSAVYYAVGKWAKVINMSFSRATPSGELRRAINLANERGIIAVASVGNDGQSAPRYPAEHLTVMGVASTTNEDMRSSFSNYGSSVWVAAPGEGVITTYPLGTFAAAWGTSFSTPMVSGAAALLAGLQPSADQDDAAALVAHAQYVSPGLNHGRLDLYQAVEAARALWPNAPVQPAPGTCGLTGSDWLVPEPPPEDPPAEDPPAEDPPAEDPPAEDPPAEDPPAEDPPAEDPPAEDPPAEDPPAEDPPAEDPPAEDPPAEDPPAEDPPAEDPPPGP